MGSTPLLRRKDLIATGVKLSNTKTLKPEKVWEELLVSLGFAANVRGEALSLTDYAAIAAKLHDQFTEK